MSEPKSKELHNMVVLVLYVAPSALAVDTIAPSLVFCGGYK